MPKLFIIQCLQVLDDEVFIANIDVIAIGFREGYQVYQDAYIERINKGAVALT